MSGLIRISKSASDWTSNDLVSFNISVMTQDEEEFFGVKLHGDVDISEYPRGILSPEPDRRYPESYMLLKYLDLAMSVRQSEESVVDDFASRLLECLGYTDMDHFVCTHKNIRLLMCGINVYVMTEDEILLLIQEDKSHISLIDPEPQLIAEAIVAFQHNNSIRMRDLGQCGLKEYTFHCLTMVGTYPTFYKIKVSKDLDNTVRFGSYPEESAQVYRFEPVIGRGRYRLGMKDVDNRIRILECFEDFRSLIPILILSYDFRRVQLIIYPFKHLYS